MKYGLYIAAEKGNNKIEALDSSDVSSLQRLGQGAGVGSAIGTVIPGVGNTIGGVIGGAVGLVSGIFRGTKRKRPREWGAQYVASVWAEAFGSERLQIRTAPGGGQLVEVSGSYDLEQVNSLVSSTRTALRQYSCERGGCGRVANMADSLQLAKQSRPPRPNWGQIARITITERVQTNASNNGVRQFGGVTGAGIAAIAAAIFFR